MKTKILISFLVMIACEATVFAQNESPTSFQIKMENYELSNKLADMNYIPSANKNEDFRTSITGAKLELDSPLIPVDTNYRVPEHFKTRLPQALYVPAIMIAWGASVIGNGGLYSSQKAKTDLLNFTKGKGGPVDNYLLLSPYVEFGVLLLLKVKCNSDFINSILLIAKSEILMLAIIEPMKYITHEQRPDKSDYLSMPSGHTAEAFCAATIVYREYRYLSPWYGICAYTLATTVGVFRMVNDKHWESDVFIGGGIGMACTNIVYATHQHRWGRNGVCFSPMYDGKNKGATMAFSF